LPKNYLLFSLHNFLLISLVVSIFFYLFHPVVSETGRFFGTYGSPNGSGFVAASALMFMFMMLDLEICSKIRIYLTVTISLAVLILSASLSVLGSLFIFLFIYYAIKLFKAKKIYIKKSYFIPFIIFTLAGLALLVQLVQSESAELIIRIAAINSQNDTVLIRVIDNLKVINMDCPNDVRLPYLLGCQSEDYLRLDSTLFSFAYNLGYLATFIFLCVLYSPFFTNFFKKRSNKISFLPSLLAFYFSVVPINLVMKHSFELFPTNIIYASIIVFSIFYSSKADMLYNR
jgi:hypothetical protein